MDYTMDIDTPWMFSNPSATQQSQASTPALALARTGGPNGTTYLYTLDDAPVGFEAGGGLDGAHLPPKAVANTTTQQPYLTPPNSLSMPSTFRIPASSKSQAPAAPSYPLTPSSYASLKPSSNIGLTRSDSARSHSSSSSSSSHSEEVDVTARCGPVLPLIHSVFPTAATDVASTSHILEIVTPPDHVLHGFIADSPELGRVVFVHLPPTHASAPSRPEVLVPHFSNVLRPDEPRYASPAPPRPAGPVALDIRESLTALLDLADEIEGTQLVLILDKDERDPAPLAELMHALMYVGGTPVRPGAPVADWQWDARRWALVSIEL